MCAFKGVSLLFLNVFFHSITSFFFNSLGFLGRLCFVLFYFFERGNILYERLLLLESKFELSLSEANTIVY